MSKILEASCVAGVVTADSLVVVADVLSAGLGESDGVVLLEGEMAKYLTSNASDISDLIDKLATIVEKIVIAATGLDAASNAPGGQTANIALITAAKLEMVALKLELK